MIAKSDLIILTISSLALVAGVYRWQQNVAAPAVAAAPAASVRVVERAPRDTVDSGRNAATTVAGTLGEGTTATATARPATDGTLTVRRLDADGRPRDERPAENRDVAAANGIDADPTGPSTDVAANVADESDRALYGVYRVRSGDYLGRIASRFGTSVATLQRINGIEGSLIEIGDEIRYPLPAN